MAKKKKAYIGNPGRVRPADIAQAIHKQEDRVAVGIEEEDRKVIAYTLAGEQDEMLVTSFSEDDDDGYPVLWSAQYEDDIVPSDERDNAFAKQVLFEDGEHTQVKYFVKRGPTGRLLNPLGIFDDRHQKTRLGLNTISWREVPKLAFTYYIKFLKSKNQAWLQHAEREVF